MSGEIIVIGPTGVERWTADQLKRLRKVEIPYKPYPKQEQFHRFNARYRLFGGAAGPGKSMALLMEAVRVANQDYKSVQTQGLILRRTYEELETSIIQKFRSHVPPELYKSYSEVKKTVTWHNASLTRFGYCKLEKDIWQYQGGEYIFVGWDELTQFTLSQW